MFMEMFTSKMFILCRLFPESHTILLKFAKNMRKAT